MIRWVGALVGVFDGVLVVPSSSRLGWSTMDRDCFAFGAHVLQVVRLVDRRFHCNSFVGDPLSNGCCGLIDLRLGGCCLKLVSKL